VTTEQIPNGIHINDFLDHLRVSERLERPSWDQVWMETAKVLSRRSLDPRFQVGTVIVTEDNTQVLAVGYNGDHRGGPNEVESREPGQSGFIHAEINALIKCDFNHPKGKKMYLTLSPCRQCAKAIINGGISEVIYLEEYRDTSGIKLLAELGVVARQYR
jgi:dCMP deaminase